MPAEADQAEPEDDQPSSLLDVDRNVGAGELSEYLELIQWLGDGAQLLGALAYEVDHDQQNSRPGLQFFWEELAPLRQGVAAAIDAGKITGDVEEETQKLAIAKVMVSFARWLEGGNVGKPLQLGALKL